MVGNSQSQFASIIYRIWIKFITNNTNLYQNQKLSQTMLHINQKARQAMLGFQALNLPTLQKILNYLTITDLETLRQSITHIAQFEQLTNIIKMRLIYLKYYNKSDRSYYCSVYELAIFRNMEIETFDQIVVKNRGNFEKLVYVEKKMTEAVGNCVGWVSEEFREELGQHIQGMFLNPSIPMPKLLRETLPSASTPFQNFLLSILSDSCPYPQPPEQIFSQIVSQFTESQQVTLRNMIQNYSKCTKLIYAAHCINSQKINEYIISGNSMHNLLVSLFGITGTYLDSVHEYLKIIQDEGQLLVELTTRYQMFVGTVISIQQNFGELLQNYGQLYDELFNQSSQTVFNYWKPAMKMWEEKMSQFYESTTPYFIHLCQQNLKNCLATALDQQKYSQIFSRLSLISSSQTLSIYNNSVVEGILKQHCSEEIQIVINNYLESLVDLGIDERSLLMNGHSEQQIVGLYQKMEKMFINCEQNWVKLIKECNFDDFQFSLVTELIQQKLTKFNQISKPRTTKSIQTVYLVNNIKLVPKKSQIQTDNQIEHCLEIIKRLPSIAKYLQLNSQTVSVNGLKSKLTLKSMLHETADSDREALDDSFEFYDSDQEKDTIEGEAHPKIVEKQKKQANIQVNQKLDWQKEMVKQLSKSR